MNNDSAINSKKDRIIDILKRVLRVALPLICSVLLMVWLFRKVDFRHIMGVLRHGVDYGWLLLVMVIVTLSHIIRGIRWGIQLRGAGVGKVPGMVLCCSIFGAYAMNLLVPYMGEAWRVIYIAKRQKVPVSTVLGTDIGDRGSDAVVVICLLLLALCVGHRQILAFMDHYKVGERIYNIVSDTFLWIGIVGVIGTFITVLYFFRNRNWAEKFILSLKRTWNGFRILFTMKGRWPYLWLTLGIWTCYFLETYISFFAFPFTRELIGEHGMAFGLLPGLISFVFSSMSMAIPSNGGLGPWNLAVMFALSLFGISDTDGAAFSMLVWSTTTLTLVILGIYTMGYVAISRRRGKKQSV